MRPFSFSEALQYYRRSVLDNQDVYRLLVLRHLGLNPRDVARRLEEDADEGLQESIAYHYDKLLPYAARRIGLRTEELRRRSNGIVLRSPQRDAGSLVNAWSVFDRDRFSVIVNLPLMLFFWRMAKLWSTRVAPMEIPGHPREEAVFSFEATVRMAEKLMTAYWQGRRNEGETVSLLRLSQSQTAFAGTICHYGERFVVSHELGHLVARDVCDGVSDLLDWAMLQARMFLSSLLRKYPDWPRGANEEDLVQRWGEEYAADLIGMHLVLDATESDFDRINTYWSVELTLITFGMLEEFCFSRDGGHLPPLTDHPFSACRLAMLRSFVHSPTHPEVLDILRFVENMSREILFRLGIRPVFGVK